MQRLVNFLRANKKAIIVLGIFVVGFYLLYFLIFLLPSIQSARILHRAGAIIENSKLTLSENNLLYYRFLSLDPDNPHFYDDKSNLISLIDQSNTEGADYFSQKPDPISTFLVNRETKDFVKSLNSDMKESYQESTLALTNQRPAIDDLKRSEEILHNIFRYDPLVDFAYIDQHEDNAEKAATAAREIGEIRTSLNASELPGRAVLSVQMGKAVDELEILLGHFESGNSVGASAQLANFDREFRKLKGDAYTLQKDIIKSEGNLQSLLYIQSEIESYQDKSKKVIELQNELNQDPLEFIIMKLPRSSS
ncbi:hypothetical protein ACFL2C_03225 [Patescibacteria group bacterium]